GGGPVTEDGCPVRVYAQLPDAGEADLVAARCPDGGSILDLGAGAGRIADPLASRGFEVLAVDASQEMLDHVQRARPVCSRIEDLDLWESFDVVLLASHLVNTPTEETRRALLAAAARHVKRTGQVVIQWHPPEWFDGLGAGVQATGQLGPFSVTLSVHELREGLLDATVAYQGEAETWHQHFRARRLTYTDLDQALSEVSLGGIQGLVDDFTWLSAKPVRAARA
ncbi:MAG: class I SAM-dependent methyltransferase, partial [Actinomycetes bacterium]